MCMGGGVQNGRGDDKSNIVLCQIKKGVGGGGGCGKCFCHAEGVGVQNDVLSFDAVI